MVHAGKKKNKADRNYNQAHYYIMTMDRHIDGRVGTDRHAVITAAALYCVCYLSGPSLVVPGLSESLQTSSVKPETGRVAPEVDTHMSLYQHPGIEQKKRKSSYVSHEPLLWYLWRKYKL